MPQTVPFDVEKLDEPRQEQVKGVTVTLHASPYDLPDGALKTYDPKQQRLVLRLRYIGSPERSVSVRRDDTELKFGNETGRIFEIIVAPASDEDSAFTKAIAALTAENLPKGNRDIIVAALKQQRSRLFDFQPDE
ncbi:MAG: hypothetical protein WD069_03790 [Planctomycetales bacterium]